MNKYIFRSFVAAMLGLAVFVSFGCSLINDGTVITVNIGGSGGARLIEDDDRNSAVFDIYFNDILMASKTRSGFTGSVVTGSKVVVNVNAFVEGVLVANGQSSIKVAAGENVVTIVLHEVKESSGSGASSGGQPSFTPSENSVAYIDTDEYDDFETAFNAVLVGQTLTLLKDVSISDKLTVNKDMTLDLNGKTITQEMEQKQVFTITGATLTLTDSSSSGTGNVTGVKNSSNGAIYLSATPTSKLIMINGNISGNQSSGGGGAIKLGGSGSEFEMRGGTISRNTTTNTGGGAIYAKTGANIVIKDGNIENNTAQGLGGGGIYLEAGANLTMENGTITSNTSNSPGKAIFAKDSGTFTVGGNSTTSCDSIVNGVVQ